MREACKYTRSAISATKFDDLKRKIVIISFSFVNTDLRDIFAEEFPLARWIHINTSESLAEKRLAAREKHFYKGAPENVGDEWKFAAVDFDHLDVDGSQNVEDSSLRIAEYIVSKRKSSDI
jgi:gluconate kinase